MTDSLQVWEFPSPFIIMPRNYFYFRLKYTTTGEDIAGILGITFAKASYIQTETPTLQSP